jgi:cytochrome bd ubiquinol oxidase subunit II
MTIWLMWLIMGISLMAYVLTGGADFGSGVWYLLARGSRKEQQRSAIEKAIAPIWEANHVWLIFIIVMCFTVFPRAFYTMSVALHIPITVALLGIVFRGAAFVFRTYGMEQRPMREAWGRIFAGASIITPICLGMTLGALATGEIRVTHGLVTSGFTAGWTTQFAFAVGCFALALFALLAAVYLTVDAPHEVRNDFRVRAIASEIVAGIFALWVLFAASFQAPIIWQQFVESPWMWPLQGLTALAATFVIVSLWNRRFRLARIAVIVQVICVVCGFGVGMRGYIVYPDVTLDDSIMSSHVAQALQIALPIGMALILPSLWYLFRVFKSRMCSPGGPPGS